MARTTSRRIVALAATVLIVALAVSACSSGSSSSPTPAASASAVFSAGSADVKIASSLAGSFTAPLMIGRIYNNGAALNVQYGDVQQGSLTYLGPAAPGTYKTERTDAATTSLALVVVVQGGGGGDVPYKTFSSINGECSVTIVKIDKTGGNATFACNALKSDDGTTTIDATGSFEARP